MLAPDEIITVLTGAAGVTGGYFGGKKMGQSAARQDAVNTVELLQVAVGELTRQAHNKDEELADLRARVCMLEDLVTQRPQVEAVHADVKGVRVIVDRIAGKLEV